jgi:hypothetical protein
MYYLDESFLITINVKSLKLMFLPCIGMQNPLCIVHCIRYSIELAQGKKSLCVLKTLIFCIGRSFVFPPANRTSIIAMKFSSVFKHGHVFGLVEFFEQYKGGK